MLKKLLPLILVALLLPAAAFADNGMPQEMWVGGIMSPDQLGTRISTDITDMKGPSLRVDTKWPTTICINAIDTKQTRLDQSMLTFSAEMKSSSLQGSAYLELAIHLTDGQIVFSRGMERPLSGTLGWNHFETSFTLSKGQVADHLTLNLIVNGKGSIWLKGVKLMRTP